MKIVEKKRSGIFGLPLSCTKYVIDEEQVTIHRGFIEETEDYALMYKIRDVRLKRKLCERLFGLGTIICYTGDITSPELVIEKVKKFNEIKDFIIHASEESRQKRREMIAKNFEMP
jgi:uncharacterized membrane protein YdbT with pleckstrin-like domain